MPSLRTSEINFPKHLMQPFPFNWKTVYPTFGVLLTKKKSASGWTSEEYGQWGFVHFLFIFKHFFHIASHAECTLRIWNASVMFVYNAFEMTTSAHTRLHHPPSPHYSGCVYIQLKTIVGFFSKHPLSKSSEWQIKLGMKFVLDERNLCAESALRKWSRFRFYFEAKSILENVVFPLCHELGSFDRFDWCLARWAYRFDN